MATQPQHGTLELNPDGSFTYQQDSSEATDDGFSYTLSVSEVKSTALVTLSIHAAPSGAPVANADAYTLDEGGTLTVGADKGVLVNDSNPLAGSLSASVQTPPHHGTLTLNSDGSFVYVHDHSETTTDGFVYSLGNGTQSAQANAVLTIYSCRRCPIAGQARAACLRPPRFGTAYPATPKQWLFERLIKRMGCNAYFQAYLRPMRSNLRASPEPFSIRYGLHFRPRIYL